MKSTDVSSRAFRCSLWLGSGLSSCIQPSFRSLFFGRGRVWGGEGEEGGGGEGGYRLFRMNTCYDLGNCLDDHCHTVATYFNLALQTFGLVSQAIVCTQTLFYRVFFSPNTSCAFSPHSGKFPAKHVTSATLLPVEACMSLSVLSKRQVKSRTVFSQINP